MKTQRYTLILMVLVTMLFGLLSTVEAQDECEATVTLTIAGITLEGCEGDTLVELAEQIQEDANPTAEDLEVNEWEVTWFAGATNQMRGRGSNPWPALENVAPTLWPTFPNVDNEDAEFEASDGLEYGMAESSYCQNDVCDVVVPAEHYRLITADYNLGFDTCIAGEEFTGCAIMIVNVGSVSSNFEDVMVDNGFTVFGRYWNGDTLPVAINALMSHTAYNMLGLEEGVNRGSNCSNPEGCKQVRLTVIIVSGNQVLGVARTFVSIEEAEG